MRIDDIERDKNGDLPAYAWPGGYPIIYLTGMGDTLCADCATKEAADPDANDPAVLADVFYEGAPIDCDDCGKKIESAYGEPDNT